MPINFACPHCGAKITAPTAYGGRPGKCNQCGKGVTIPEASDAGSTVLSGGLPPHAATGAETAVPIPARTSAPPAYAPPAGTAKRSSTLLLIGVGLVGVLALAAWALLRGESAGAGPLDLAAQAPPECVAVAAMSNPQKALKELIATFDELSEGNAEAKNGWNKAKQEAREKLGFDVANLDAYAQAGFDATKPLTLAVLEIKDQQKEPSGVIFGIGVTVPETALNTLKAAAVKVNAGLSEDTGGTPTVLASKDLAAAVQEGRLYLAVGPPDANKAELLRAFLQPKNKSLLRDSPSFRAATGPLQGPADWSGYLDLKAIANSLPASGQAALQELSGISFATQEAKGTAFLLFSEAAGIKKHLLPGGTCREFLAKLEQPFAALAFSLADPVGLLKYSAEKGEGVSAIGRLDDACQASLGMDLNALGKLLKDSAGGVAVYPSEGGFVPIGVLAFVKVRNKEEAAGALQKILTRGPVQPEKKTFGDNFLYSVPFIVPFWVGLVDGYVVAGNSKDRIEALAKGSATGWKPKVGGTELLSLELFLGEAAKHFLLAAPAEAKKLLKQIADENAYVCLALAGKDNGVLLTSESRGQSRLTAGAAIAAAIAVPNLQPSPMAANESAASAGCKTYAEAQDIYRRTDWDGDGLLEYAQALKGAHSLFEKTPGTGDLTLVDQAFAQAEGVPSQGAIPKAGYCFKVLKGQGQHAPGGRKSYVVPGSGLQARSMTLGYALVAFPAQYDKTGRNTFLINNTGTVYQKDLGAATLSMVGRMTEYDPESTWVVSE